MLNSTSCIQIRPSLTLRLCCKDLYGYFKTKDKEYFVEEKERKLKVYLREREIFSFEKKRGGPEGLRDREAITVQISEYYQQTNKCGICGLSKAKRRHTPFFSGGSLEICRGVVAFPHGFVRGAITSTFGLPLPWRNP